MINKSNIQQQDIKFLSNPALEFINIIFSVSNLNLLIKDSEKIKYEIKEEILESLNDIIVDLSRFMKQELNNFFVPPFDLGYKLIFKFIIDDTDVVSVSSLIKNIKKSNSDYIVDTISEFLFDKKFDTIDTLIKKIESKDLDENEKEYLIDFIVNNTEIHNRIVNLLTYFYKEVYKPLEEDILYILKMEKTKIEDDFYRDPSVFFDKYLRDIDFQEKKPLRIHPSLFKQIWKDTLDSKYRFWVNLGVHSDRLNNANLKKKNVLLLYKILSDKTRLDMIMMLSEKQHFVNELADRLNISSPAVSHHISYLNKLNLVELKRDEHRYYYILNKERLEELLTDSNELLLKK
jgi:DNA-binding transcriptional ArsR family regulator